MRKRIIKKAVTLLMAFAMALCVTCVPSMAANSTITETKAKQIALKDAGLAESEVIFIKTDLIKEGTSSTYDIEFCHGTYEYTYEINAASGEIIDYEIDCEYYVNPGAKVMTSVFSN